MPDYNWLSPLIRRESFGRTIIYELAPHGVQPGAVDVLLAVEV